MSSRTSGISDEDITRVEEMVARIASGTELLDDRRGLMPQAFSVLSQIPSENPAGLRINNHIIRLLYETIPHPIATLLGEDRFRQADGSRNNVLIPSLGQAGTPYTRTCQGKHPLPIPSLPDSALVFDELLKATDQRAEHPGKNSSLTFAFAAIVTHSLFRTDPKDWNKNNTSSYFDLSPLYGSNQAEQNAVRIKDGRGRLYPDTFSEGRLVFLPPASASLLVLWSRNHNYIADTILGINEQGKWRNPPPEDAGERAAQDEEIFQTARLVNCGSFMSVILGDYVAGFLGLGRNGSSWAMQPFDPFKGPNNLPVDRGQGNHVSVEFNLLYRWHSVPSDDDEEWTLGVFKKLFGDRSFGSLTLADFYEALGRLKTGAVHPDLIIEPEPRKRNFGGIKRGPDGRFNDDDLAFILQNSTESVAHRYGARGTPEVFKVVEILGIEQARRWGVCSMNEFRIRMGLKPFATFEEWNRDPAVANAARKLYGTVDNLELYPGLHAEETMTLGPGSGLCAGYTITRSILSDAIALIRGDRFFTTDYTPTNLTAWGIQDVARDPNNGAFGAYLPKLLMRALPRHYPHNSAYSLFPFFTPSATKENLTRLKLADKYDFERPVATPPSKVINSLSGIKYVLGNPSKYEPRHGLKMGYITNQKAVFLAFDEGSQQGIERLIVLRALFPGQDDLDKHAGYYQKTTWSLIQTESVSGKSIDEVAGLALGVAVAATVNYAQAIAHTIDFYLQAQHHKELQHIIELSSMDNAESLELLAGYYREAARLNPQPSGHFHTAAENHEILQDEDLPSIHVNRGDFLFCSYKNACLDPDLFPSPTKINPRRPVESYDCFLRSTGIGREFSERTIPVIMKEIFSLKNLRRAPGPKGVVRYFTDADENKIYLSLDGGVSSWPTSLVLLYDS
ncbi:hypothetical protein FRC11_005607 [Ceratobasidium sp. 423]|nr:hypothetical protein FRC11_005607 [Ceratobasidium sp. 423]